MVSSVTAAEDGSLLRLHGEEKTHRCAVVLDGEVLTVTMCGPDWNPIAGDVAPCSDRVGSGWKYANGEFEAPPEQESEQLAPVDRLADFLRSNPDVAALLKL